LLSKCKIKISRFILDKDSFTKTKKKRERRGTQNHHLSESLMEHTLGQ
jgi:hypothetical protein